VTTAWPAAPPTATPHAALPDQPRPRPIKVLHVITRFIDGAGGNTLLSAIGADASRYEMWVAGAPGGPLWERAERHGVRTVRLERMREVLSPADDLRVYVALVRLIRRERFAIVHTHSSKGGFLGRAAAFLCRTPIAVHTIHGFSYHEFMPRPRRALYLLLERMVRPMTDAFLAVAPQVAREAVEQRVAPPGGVRVVPSGVELDEIEGTPDPTVRDELGVPADAPLIGMVARLEFQKAPVDFVRMAAKVRATHPGARFVIVGDGSLADQVRAEARRLGVDVTFTGFRADATRITGALDVFVVSSLYEGLGRSLTEALAAARPVVATAVNGVVDLVEPGATGLLAPPADPDALARNVAWLLDNPDAAHRMGQAARERVLRLFHPSVMCRCIEETYEQLLGLPSARDSSPATPHVVDVRNGSEPVGASASFSLEAR
jgi:glycosyltransferase involved in cell wall biosynthesis